MDIPLRRLTQYRRDVGRELVSAALDDGQLFTGRLVRLPNVAIVIEGNDGKSQSYPLANIAQFETTALLLNRPALITP